MSSISRDEVAHLAELARLSLTDAELDHLAPQLDTILTSVARVGEVASSEVPPTSHPLPLVNVFRPDEVHGGLDRQEVLEEAPAAEEQRFRVPRILDE